MKNVVITKIIVILFSFLLFLLPTIIRKLHNTSEVKKLQNLHEFVSYKILINLFKLRKYIIK